MTSIEGSARPPDPARLEGSRTNREDRSRWWRPWVAVFSGSVGILLSVLAWNALRETERVRIAAGLETIATELSYAFESGFGQQIEHLRDLASTWSRTVGDGGRRWQAEARMFRNLHEECLALEWDPRTSGVLTTGTPEAVRMLHARHSDTANEAARQAAIAGSTELRLGPYPGPSGRPIVEILIPARAEGGQVGYLTALIDPANAIARMAGPRSEDVAVEVFDGRTSLFRRGEPAGEELSGLMEVRTFRSGIPESELRIEVRPARRMLASPHRFLQWSVLIGGILLSTLFAITFWVGQAAMLRKRDYLAANLQLQERQRELQQAGEVVRKQEERITAIQEERHTLMSSLKAEMEARAAQVPDTAVTELETFTYSVSHDLRSPMGAILNYAAILEEDCGDKIGEEGREYLGRISASAQKAIAMMDGLLSFSRVGRRELKIAEVDVARTVREIHAELCVSRSGVPPTLSMGSLPTVHGDPTLLWTLFNNLLSNAFKFTQGVENPRVGVGGYVQGADVVYYVEDNGIGFDMRHVSKLFGVFERLPSTHHHDGHGIGLAVVKRIAARHGGSVRAEGVPGKGATFFVTLPIDSRPTDRGGAAGTSGIT